MKNLVLILLALMSTQLFGQNPSESKSAPFKKNAVYVELLGNGVLGSINYDRNFIQRNRFKFGGRVGYSYLYFWHNEGLISGGFEGSLVPAELYVLHGTRHHFEGALGTTLFASHIDDRLFAIPTGRVGYRFQRPEGGFVFRAGLTILFIVPSVGLSFGYSF